MTHSVKYLIGDTREQVATIPDGSVSLVASSPPFIALRSYLPADHPLKHAEIGSEPDPATFLDTLLQLTAEWGRVLAPWGSIAIELGDTYSATTAGGERSDGGQYGYHAPQTNSIYNALPRPPKGQGNWPRPKCLALVPQLYAASLAYGRNLLTGQPSPAGQWLVRNMIVWHRPNPAVGALGDKYRPSTSYITVATRSPKRWFDLTAVRGGEVRHAGHVPEQPAGATQPGNTNPFRGGVMHSNPAGAPPLDAWTDHHDTWTITTQPSSLAHYAMWPAKLAERLILSMCPAEVCATCGEPRRRIEGKTPQYAAARAAVGDFKNGNRESGLNGTTQYVAGVHMDSAQMLTLGFTDCGHNNYQPGTVLDPFAGTGTTLAVAALHGRNAIGIDIDSRNADMYNARYQEVKRSLFGTTPELPGQEALFT